MSTSFTERYALIKATRERQKKEMLELGQNLFEEGTEALFNEFPNLHGFRTTAYRPYFNDGDACLYNVNTDYPDLLLSEDLHDEELAEEELSDDYDADGGINPKLKWGSYYFWRKEDGDEMEVQKIHYAVKAFLEVFDDDDFEQLFGDHVEITVRRTPVGARVTTEVYEHD